MSRKLLYFIISVACFFTLMFIWWILPTRPTYEAAGINVGVLITSPPVPYKPPLDLTFEPNGKVTFSGSYWHPQTVYLYFREDINNDIVYNVAVPFNDFWSYADYFSPGYYSVQVRIIDNMNRWSLYSDKVYFSIPTPLEPATPLVIPASIVSTTPTITTEPTLEPEKGKEEKREEAPRGSDNWIERIIKAVNENKAIIIAAIVVTALLAIINITISFIAMLATELSLYTYVLVIINNLFLFFWRRRKEKKGLVYDRTTGRPVPGVLVNILGVPKMNHVASAVTDKDGTFMLMVDGGDYVIQIKKDGYNFPANIDPKVADSEGVYVGQIIHILAKRDGVNVKIPIEVQEMSLAQTSKSSYLFQIYRGSDIVRILLLIFGSVVSVAILNNYHSPVNYIIATCYLILWIVELNIVSHKIKFGRVLDARKRKPINLALVRTVSPEGKLTQTYVTDILGRFLPYVPGPKHSISIQKPDYELIGFVPESKKFIEGKKFYLPKIAN